MTQITGAILAKTCSRCKVAQPLGNFNRQGKKGKHGVGAYCKDCANDYQKHHYRKKRDAENAGIFEPTDTLLNTLERDPRSDAEMRRANQRAYRKERHECATKGCKTRIAYANRSRWCYACQGKRSA